MGNFSPSKYIRPENYAQVSRALLRYKDTARIVGGGTGLYEFVSRGLLSNIDVLVDLEKLRLNRVSTEKDNLSIGASVTLSELEEHKLCRDGIIPCISEALYAIRPLQVKNAATVGGAICSCIPFFDLPVALGALSASVEVRGARKTRTVSVIDFFKDFLQPDLRRGEFMTRIIIKDYREHKASAFSKFAQTGDDWAIVNCACSLSMKSKKIHSCNVVFGGVSSSMTPAKNVVAELIGSEATSKSVEAASEVLEKDLVDVTSDIRASDSFRRKIAKSLFLDAMESALSRLKGQT